MRPAGGTARKLQPVDEPAVVEVAFTESEAESILAARPSESARAKVERSLGLERGPYGRLDRGGA